MPAAACRLHHLVHWVDGGTTDRGVLGCFCEGHHHALHEGGFTVQGDADGERAFTRPDGRVVGSTQPSAAPGYGLGRPA